jgi:phenazine biosynthesis protein phzE
MLRFDRPYCLFKLNGRIHYAAGPIARHTLLADMPRPGALPVISMLPYTQLRERGYVVHDGNEPILSLSAEEYDEVDLDELGPPVAVELRGGLEFVVSDTEFEARTARIIADEIRNGEGSNFVLSRKCRVKVDAFDAAVANEIFARLVRAEFGAYMTFCFFDGERYFIGSSPERHMSLERGVLRMNPISGTLPKVALESRADMLEFLADPKEVNELFQVVDEELKMMSRICSAGGEVHGPYLKEMSTLFHTEYVLEGRTELDPIDALRHSMFAPTLVGSPLENAARVICKYENDSRRYYAGAIVLMGVDDEGREHLDSAITIRTMELDAAGNAVIQSGASIVRDSVPAKECREIKAKAAGLLRAVSSASSSEPVLAEYLDESLEAVLRSRNEFLSRFWLKQQKAIYLEPRLASKSLLIIDNEDDFTQMLRHVISHLGVNASIRKYDDPGLDLSGSDCVLIGPGPGDPRDLNDPKIKKVRELLRQLLHSGSRFMAVCLGHQVLCQLLGFELQPLDPPLQGVQKAVELFGRLEAVGFYNTFFARMRPGIAPDIEISSEPDGRIIATRGPHFYSLQFHAESVLTTNSIPIIRDALLWLLNDVWTPSNWRTYANGRALQPLA